MHPCRDKAHQLLNLPPSPDLPTYGQPSCIHCHLFLFIDSQHFCYAFNSNLQILLHHPTDGTIDMNVTMMANCSLPYHLHLMSSGLPTVLAVYLEMPSEAVIEGCSAHTSPRLRVWTADRFIIARHLLEYNKSERVKRFLGNNCRKLSLWDLMRLEL